MCVRKGGFCFSWGIPLSMLGSGEEEGRRRGYILASPPHPHMGSLSVYYVPGAVPDSGDSAMSKGVLGC